MPAQPLIVGNPVFVVVDMQESGDMPAEEVGIAHMPGYDERISRTRQLLTAARSAGIPVVFFQEVHRPSGVDFGRELDGTEGPHCIDGRPGTPLHPDLLPEPGEFHIVKRRYSGFIGTDFEIVLRGLRASTLILVGGLTDVCVHYTFADAHQRDYYVRVVSDCVGGSSQYRHDAALDAMEYLQTGAVRTSDEILAAFATHNQILEGAAR
ncbi:MULTISPECIES: cysteine hydrolase family protein [Mycolicibacterium]|uniref:Isochorismatase n=1 Tax=Mycolicibacterium mageritense TaxID=53462 RepID=A0AAI8TSP7_MYCME|nr:cysteine hydrolase [Mycolicibacterium mageritense]MBN3458349.1 cysteine hydrolase [Mycobacterium sp. DSM 3803]OKH79985.1 cysteine hydrolase [Mycobacterium sp. SWH-M3]MCC9182891.1 cysteine hydrolase [Mycolicibacterium mageritense]TXI63348.1 MAG: cysteine hydrolase [Mycolicibacterium mageritense]CDO22190.1 isochorismatase hydrolase [Mycolicibacterium mageritense DSM 44476 = CIP 104973]